MIYSFDKNLFDNAIKEKNFIRLKSNTVSAINNDPTFSNGEVKAIIAELEAKIPEIFEEEIHLEYENRVDESMWDERYFSKMAFWFEYNFAKSRLAEIEKVGKKVYGTQKHNATPQVAALPTKAPVQHKNLAIAAGVIAGIAALVLIIVKAVH